MLEELRRILADLRLAYVISGKSRTIGEVSRRLKISKSTVRRRLLVAMNAGLVDGDFVEYKSTGKNVFAITEAGVKWLDLWKGFEL